MTRRRHLLFGQWHPRALFDAGQAGVIYLPHPSTTWQDSARTTPGVLDSPVGAIDDLSGNSNHALQATADRRPILRRTAGGHWYLDSDGVDDYLRVLFTTVQPMDRISAIQTHIPPTQGDHFFGGGNINGLVLFLGVTNADIKLFSGTFIVNSGYAPDTDFVVTERFDGASSRLALNNGAYATGDPGTTTSGGITLFASFANFQHALGRMYGVVMGNFSTLADDQIQLARNFMARRAGIVLDTEETFLWEAANEALWGTSNNIKWR